MLFSRPLRFHSVSTSESTGFGRLGKACLDALGMLLVSPIDYPDFVMASPVSPCASAVRFTMWEPDSIPKTARGFMAARTLIVPCSMNVDLFRNAGFKGLIHRVGLWGEARWAPIPDEDVFRFICVGKDSGVRSRKGIDELMEYFTLAFPSEKDVRLTIKCSPACARRVIRDDRITAIYDDMSKEKYEALLSEHHCGVFLSGLEAWNFPACELMAAGRPSIIVPWGGPADFTTPETSWHLDYTMVTAPDENPYNGHGRGARPTKDSAIAALRDAYGNRQTFYKKADASYRASFRLSKDQFSERLRVVAKDIFGNL